MEIDFSKTLEGFAGQPIKLRPSDEGGATLGMVCAEALFAALPGDDRLTGTEKAKRGNLGLRIASAKLVELSPEDAAMIRECVGKAYSPLIVARVYELTG